MRERITFEFEKESIKLDFPETMLEIEKVIEKIFDENKKILPKNKNAKILLKPNFNNDLNALTGNSTDFRIIVAVLKKLRKEGYKKIIIGEGCNCGINHIGIDVFKRLGIDKIAKMFGAELINFNKDKERKINLTTGSAKIAKTILEADFIIDLPVIKTHVEAGMTCACKNYMGALIGVEKRKMHDALEKNIVRLNEVIKTSLIIVDGLICMEGRGPGDGIPKKLGIILSGKNPFLMDSLVSRLIGFDFKKIGFLQEAIKQKKFSEKDIKKINEVNPLVKFKPGIRTFADKILLNNFFIGIRFSKIFEKIFNRGIIPWLLYKIGVKQDEYILEEKEILQFNFDKKKEGKIKRVLEEYCPLSLKNPNDKNCIKCMYCYQVTPEIMFIDGKLGSFEMQMNRFNKPLLKTLKNGR